MTAERDIQAAVLLAAGSLPGVRLFRNTVGEGWVGSVVARSPAGLLLRNPSRVTFGLHPGSPDLVGWREVTVTPGMIGRKMAVFVGLEVKSLNGKLHTNQENFLSRLSLAGACAAVVRSPAEAVAVCGKDPI